MKALSLCRFEELADPGSRGFSLPRDGAEPLELFVVRRGDAVYAYRNRCPHTGAPLEWQPDQFLDFDGHYIQCALHGALFGIADGRCLRGPCAGDRLVALPVGVRDGLVELRIDA